MWIAVGAGYTKIQPHFGKVTSLQALFNSFHRYA